MSEPSDLQAFIEDLDRSIAAAEEAVLLAPDCPEHARALLTLNSHFNTRFGLFQRSDDLHHLIATAEEAVRLANDDLDRSRAQVALASALMLQISLGQSSDDLERAVALTEEAVLLAPVGVDRALALGELSGCLDRRCILSDSQDDADRSVTLAEEAVLLALEGPVEIRSDLLANLGYVLGRRFERVRVTPDLERAIDMLERAIAMAASGPRRTRFLMDLSVCLNNRFTLSGDYRDLERCVSLVEEALNFTPDGEVRLVFLHQLAAYLSAFLAIKDDETLLARCIELSEKVLQSSPQESWYLRSLAGFLRVRFQLDPDHHRVDLERAIALLDQAFTASPGGRDLVNAQGELAACLWTRFNADDSDLRQKEHIDRAIALQAEALLLVHDEPHRSHLKTYLAVFLCNRFANYGTRSDIDRAKVLAEEVMGNSTSQLRDRLDCARMLSGWSLLDRDWEGSLRVWEVCQGLVHHLVGSLGDGAVQWLELIQGVAARAGYGAIMLGDLDAAVHLLESGQGILVAERMSGLRSTLEQAREKHPELVSNFEEASRALHYQLSSAPSDLEVSTETRSLKNFTILRTRRFNEARAELEAAVGPLLPDMDLASVVAVATSAGEPLVYLLATELGGAALVISSTGECSSLRFDALNLEQVGTWRLALDESGPVDSAPRRGARAGDRESGAQSGAVMAVVQEMGIVLAGLEALGHLRLIPIGTLTGLPIAAAVARNHGTAATICASAQLHQLALERPRPASSSMSVVANPIPCSAAALRGLFPLSGAQEEARALQDDFGANVFTAMRATKGHLREVLASKVLALHLSTHGIGGTENPNTSAILLADHRNGRPEQLTLGELRHDGVGPWLVFLACCWLGANGRTLPDEAIGFPTILCERGAGATIAPLWAIGDHDSVDFVRSFYKGLWSGLDPAKALAKAQHDAPEQAASTWAAFFATGW